MQLAYQHPELCERLVLVSSGGLGHSVSPLLRAAALPGSEWVLPVVAGAAGGVGAKVGGVLARVGLRAGNDVAEVGRAAWPTSATARRAWPSSTRCAPSSARAASASARSIASTSPPTSRCSSCGATRDPIIPVGHGRRAHAAVPGSEMLEIEGAGHFPQLDDPAGFVTAVNRFIARTRARGPTTPRASAS